MLMVESVVRLGSYSSLVNVIADKIPDDISNQAIEYRDECDENQSMTGGYGEFFAHDSSMAVIHPTACIDCDV